MNPDAIPALVYVNTAHGAVLSPAMYLVPKGQQPPQPGGCLTQWHIHTDLCLGGGRVVGNDPNTGCSAGSLNRVTQPMMHVWMTPVTGGPLTPDPARAQRGGGSAEDADDQPSERNGVRNIDESGRPGRQPLWIRAQGAD